MTSPISKASSTFKVLGLDPGGLTGYSVSQVNPAERKFSWIKKGELTRKEFNQFLKRAVSVVDYVVCEDFVIDTRVEGWDNTRQKSNDLFVAKMVGRVQFACFMYKKPLAIYQPAEKPLGYKKAGLPYVKGKKGTHIWDSMAHNAHFISEQWGFI